MLLGSCGKSSQRCAGDQVPQNECGIPISVARVDGREGGQQLRDDLAPDRSGSSLGGKR